MMIQRCFPDVGTAMTGRVHRFLERGTLVTLGNGLVGMIRNFDLSWLNPKAQGADSLQIGDPIEVVVLRVSEPSDNGYVYIDLGHKQTQADPWEDAETRHPVGSRAVGTVVSAEPFGAIVCYPTGFRALIPLRELSWTAHKPKVAEYLNVGQTVETEILSVNLEKRRIQASFRRTQPNPWNDISKECAVGDTATAVIESVMPYGAFARLPNGCVGLLHRTLMTASPESYTAGLHCRVRIVSVDESSQKLAFAEEVEPVASPACVTRDTAYTHEDAAVQGCVM